MPAKPSVSCWPPVRRSSFAFRPPSTSASSPAPFLTRVCPFLLSVTEAPISWPCSFASAFYLASRATRPCAKKNLKEFGNHPLKEKETILSPPKPHERARIQDALRRHSLR